MSLTTSERKVVEQMRRNLKELVDDLFFIPEETIEITARHPSGGSCTVGPDTSKRIVKRLKLCKSALSASEALWGKR